MINKKTILKINQEMEFNQNTSLPFSQGYAINSLIKEYKIPALKWGFSGDYIGIETNKQKIFWLDKGTYLEFKGILNKSDLET